MPLRLTVGFSDNPRVRPLMDGAVTAQNIELDFVTGPVGELFCRNLKYEEFDVMEMAIGCTIM
ncbi:MAG: ABC transporter substrate-binding protein, partial [Deltaproteobacteria bacterium]|nr:ABC transporter substrate-binding protein [Deltaproteobacteria bacterium]